MTAHAPLRVLVCGGRDYCDWRTLFAALDAIHAETPIGLVIYGGARGADDIACQWAAQAERVPRREFPADWRKHGRAAGPKEPSHDRGRQARPRARRTWRSRHCRHGAPGARRWRRGEGDRVRGRGE
jgi:hypothetical protein